MKIKERIALYIAKTDLIVAEELLYRYVTEPSLNGNRVFRNLLAYLGNDEFLEYFTGSVYDGFGTRRIQIRTASFNPTIVYFYGERGICNKFMTIETMKAITNYINAYLEREKQLNEGKTNEIREKINKVIGG